jgi:hypothetical protein
MKFSILNQNHVRGVYYFWLFEARGCNSSEQFPPYKENNKWQ